MKTITAEHPLNIRQYGCPYNNWHAWLARWNEPISPDERMALLHTGFGRETGKCVHDEPSYSPYDIAVFYLSIADGWNNPPIFIDDGARYPMTRENGTSTYVSRSEVSLALARKAFAVLATKFFEPLGSKSIEHAIENWHLTVVTRRVLPSLMGFFREEQRTYGFALPNLPETREVNGQAGTGVRFATSFVLKLIESIWEFDSNISRMRYPFCSSESDAAESFVARITEAKPWTIRVLYHLKKLNMVDVTRIDKGCQDVLREIAMRSEVSIVGKAERRPVKNIREAIAVDCPAAILLERHKLLLTIRK